MKARRKSVSYREWLLKKLVDPLRAERYLKQAMDDSPEMFRKAIRNVVEAHYRGHWKEERNMSYEVLIKRTIYVAQCECGERTIVDSNPPKEKLCPCGKWVKFKEESYTGPKITP